MLTAKPEKMKKIKVGLFKVMADSFQSDEFYQQVIRQNFFKDARDQGFKLKQI